MLPLEDRVRIAMGAEMGIQLTAAEVVSLAGILVTMQRVARDGTRNAGSNALAIRRALDAAKIDWKD